MDFFDHQDRARRGTKKLVVLYFLAVVSIALCVHVVIAIALQTKLGAGPSGLPPIVDPLVVLLTFGATIALILGASGVRIMSLRSGGVRVAESLGGTRVNPSTTDLYERRLLNVVEEMAIASGVPTPPVYMMQHEWGINAFAAGFAPESAVIGVTRGTTQLLDRDELQGVIAHEFSHILNGDMRMNIKAMGVLFGIMAIALIGRGIVGIFRYQAIMGSSRRSKEGGGGAVIVILLVGVALLAIGSIGAFFATWIQAAMSRQREFLADASAVQFTRNPDGIAGALKTIGGSQYRSKIRHPRASEMSHMFFGAAVTSGLSGLFATHPPLPERIRRLDPSWDGKFNTVTIPDKVAQLQSAPVRLQAALASEGVPAGAPHVVLPAVAMAGTVSRPHLVYAARVAGSIPDALVDAAHDPFSARAVVLALLLDRDGGARARQNQTVEGDAALHRELLIQERSLRGLAPEARLALLEICVPALTSLTGDQYGAFRAQVEAFAMADDQIDLFEWTLHRLIVRRLDVTFGLRREPGVRVRSLVVVRGECEVLLSALARVGHTGEQDVQRAFAEGARELLLKDVSLLGSGECGLRAVDVALERLATVEPSLKRRLVTACARTIQFDRKISVREAELMRGISESLGVPMPPVLPGQPLV